MKDRLVTIATLVAVLVCAFILAHSFRGNDEHEKFLNEMGQRIERLDGIIHALASYGCPSCGHPLDVRRLENDNAEAQTDAQ